MIPLLQIEDVIYGTSHKLCNANWDTSQVLSIPSNEMKARFVATSSISNKGFRVRYSVSIPEREQGD